MQLFCRGTRVLAVHADDQQIDPRAYGDNVRVISVGSDTPLGRYGDLPESWPKGSPDPRPFALPAPTAALLKQYAASIRYQLETAGITVNNMKIATDRPSRSMLSETLVTAQTVETFSTQWKCSDGSFLTVDKAQLQEIATQVTAHVSRCFAAEGKTAADIDSGKVTDYIGVDQAFPIYMA